MSFKPCIIIPQDIRNKIQFIVDNCTMEVSGLGTVVFDKECNGYRVTSIVIPEQEVGSAHTDLDDDAVAKALYESRNAEGELAFWWHSHVNMSVFWSHTDHKTMDDIGKNGLCVAVVFNKKEEMRGAIVMSPAGMPSVKIDEVDIYVPPAYDFSTDEVLKELKEKVKSRPVYVHNTTKTYTGTQQGLPKGTESPATKGTEVERGTIEQEVRALSKWNQMSWGEKQRYFGFEDFFDEFLWEEYCPTGNKTILDIQA